MSKERLDTRWVRSLLDKLERAERRMEVTYGATLESMTAVEGDFVLRILDA